MVSFFPVSLLSCPASHSADGKVLYVNGAGWGQAGGLAAGDAQYAGSPVFPADLFDPEAPAGKQWTTLANASVSRLYHSGAILLPSGEVITTGGEMQNYVDLVGPNVNNNCYPRGQSACTEPFEYRLEVFTPPYLSNGKPRPVISEAPATLTHNSSFMVTLESEARIQRVSLIRYSSITHNTNTDQRFVELEILGQAKNRLYLRMPKNGALAPPGNWMLFVLLDGVPSVAKTISLQLGDSTQVTVPPDAVLPKNANNASSRQSTFFLTALLIVTAVFFYV